MGTALLEAWEGTAPPGAKLRCARRDGTWAALTYPELAERVAWAVRSCWVLDAPRPTLVLAPPSLDLVTVLFTVLRGGGDICLAAPPGAFGNRDAYRGQLEHVLDTIRPGVVAAAPERVALVREMVAGCGHPTVPVVALGDGLAAHLQVRGPAADGALLQLTSGSSGPPRCLRMDERLLAQQVSLIESWLGMTDADVTATWLPLHHDMGLIGTLLLPAARRRTVHLMDPAEFLRRPGRFLALFGERGATMTAMPPFGLSQLVRLLQQGGCPPGLDLAGWRSLIVGAERIPPGLLHDVAEWLSAHGFRPESLCPAYGLAQAGLAVTGSPPGRAVRVGSASGGRPLDADAGSGAHVACGPPLPGVEVRIVDTDGHGVEAGRTGEIVVGSPTLAGYLDGGPPPAEMATGDAGFMLDDELVVVGRFGDAVKIRGRWVFAEDLEALLPRPPGGAGPVVLLGESGDDVRVIVVQHCRGKIAADPVIEECRRLGLAARPETMTVDSGRILRTSSGKPRRREMWAALAPSADQEGTT